MTIVVAKRYAKALFEVAQEKHIISQVEEELEGYSNAIRRSCGFAEVFNHPNIGCRQNGSA